DAQDEWARRAGRDAPKEGSAEGNCNHLGRHARHVAGSRARAGPQLSGETRRTSDAVDAGVRVARPEIEGTADRSDLRSAGVGGTAGSLLDGLRDTPGKFHDAAGSRS